MDDEVVQWKHHKKDFKRVFAELEELLDEFDQKKELETRLPHTAKAEAKIGELEQCKRDMESNYGIMDSNEQSKRRPKRQELNKQYEDVRTKFLKNKAGTQAMQNAKDAYAGTAEGKRDAREADTRNVAIGSKDKLNNQDKQLKNIAEMSYNLVENQGDLNAHLLNDRDKIEGVDKKLTKVDAQVAQTGALVKTMTRKEYCMKFALYIAIFCMFIADVIVLLNKLGVF